MNHQLIKKILKIVTMIAFVGIIVHQLYNIIVNGGSPSKSDEEPNDDEDDDGSYPIGGMQHPTSTESDEDSDEDSGED